LPFDVAGVRTIQFSHQDLDSANAAKHEIAKQIRAMMVTDPRIESPITVAVDLSTLSKSNKQEDRQLGEVLAAVAELKQQVSSIQRQILPRSSPSSYEHVIGSLGALSDKSIVVSSASLGALTDKSIVVSSAPINLDGVQFKNLLFASSYVPDSVTTIHHPSKEVGKPAKPNEEQAKRED
jgi:hypothetical protein